MPEFRPPSFDEEPREESPGEARQRYADLIKTITGFLGVELTEPERDKIGRFIVNVLLQMTAAQQMALSELIGKIGAWIADRYKK